MNYTINYIKSRFSGKIYLPVSLFLIFFLYNLSYAQCDLKENKHIDSTNHIISFGLIPGQGAGTSNLGVTYLKVGVKMGYSYFVTNKIMLSSDLNYIYGKSILNTFVNNNMFKLNVTGSYYVERFHFDLGYHLGNYLELKTNTINTTLPRVTQYVSGGVGMSFAFKNKLVFDVTLKQLIGINGKLNPYITKPFEGHISMGYILKGNNKRFRKNPNRLRINEILKKGVWYTGNGFAPSFLYNNGFETFNFALTLGGRYFPKDKVSFGAYLVPSFVWSKNDSISIGSKQFLPRKLNTFDVMFETRYHFLRFLYVGFSARIGSYSNYSNWEMFDRRINLKFGPQFGYYIRINNKWLLEFRRTYFFSLPKLIDNNSPKSGYFSTSLHVVRTLDFSKFKK